MALSRLLLHCVLILWANVVFGISPNPEVANGSCCCSSFICDLPSESPPFPISCPSPADDDDRDEEEDDANAAVEGFEQIEGDAPPSRDDSAFHLKKARTDNIARPPEFMNA